MPSNFQLVPKGQEKPVDLNVLDTELWNHFNGGEPEGNDMYCGDWYNTIGLALAVGRTWEQIRENYSHNSAIIVISEYLEERFNVSAWRSYK